MERHPHDDERDPEPRRVADGTCVSTIRPITVAVAGSSETISA